MNNFTVLILYNSEGKMLFQHRSAYKERLANYWGSFGGSMNDNETPEDGVRREIYEELGYISHNPLLLYDSPVPLGEAVKHVFVELYDSTQEFILNVESQGYGWFTLSETEEILMIEHDRETARRVAEYIQSLTSRTPIDIFAELKKLNFPKDEFLVAGSAIMAIKDIRPAYDLDIVVSEKLFEQYNTKEEWEIKPWTRTGRVGKDWLKGDVADLMVEIQSGDEDYNLDALKKEGENIDGVWFLSLQQLISFKRNYGRPKDFDDIALIEDYLKDR